MDSSLRMVGRSHAAAGREGGTCGQVEADLRVEDAQHGGEASGEMDGLIHHRCYGKRYKRYNPVRERHHGHGGEESKGSYEQVDQPLAPPRRSVRKSSGAASRLPATA